MRRTAEATRWQITSRGFIAATIALALLALAGEARAERRLFSEEEAAHLGLTRAWYTQVQLNVAHSRIERAVLNGDRLIVLTSAGVVQDLNALTGATYWVAPIGNENYPSLGPAASDKYVALVNGSSLYVLDRKNGKPEMIQAVGSAPGAAPAVSENYVFVPLVNGRIEAYSLTNQKTSPWYYQSYGRAMVAPLVTSESIVWTTDAGFLYVGGSNKLGMRFRLETGAEIVAPPAYHNPLVYVASLDGDVFAMQEMTGSQRWKYSCGFPVTRAPAGVGDEVFVTSGEPALHCINAKNGTGVWEVPRVKQFAAKSKDRVYAITDLGEFAVLNAANGATLAKVKVDRPLHALVNDQTDRVYLVSENGIIECLHEINLKEPIHHNPQPTPEKEKDKDSKPAAAPKALEKPAPQPPATEKADEPEEKPEAEDKAPEKKAEPATDDNPFG